MWKFIVLASILVVIGLAGYNIWSLIRKWKANPHHWFDLMMGVFVWGTGISVLIYIFLQQL